MGNIPSSPVGPKTLFLRPKICRGGAFRGESLEAVFRTETSDRGKLPTGQWGLPVCLKNPRLLRRRMHTTVKPLGKRFSTGIYFASSKNRQLRDTICIDNAADYLQLLSGSDSGCKSETHDFWTESQNGVCVKNCERKWLVWRPAGRNSPNSRLAPSLNQKTGGMEGTTAASGSGKKFAKSSPPKCQEPPSKKATKTDSSKPRNFDSL